MIKNIYEFLERSATLYPNKVAVVNGFYETIKKDLGYDCKQNYTFEELNQKVKLIATNIIKTSNILNNSSKQTSVFILLPKSAECLASFYAVALSGEFYTLQDPSTPKDRIKKLLLRLESKIIITTKKIFNDFSDVVGELITHPIFIDDLEDIDNGLIKNRLSKQIDTDLLYVLFTSGSTGEPKGVCIRHRSVIDYTFAILNEYKITQDEIFANQLPFYFDASLKDLFPPIAIGAQLHIIPNQLYAFIPKVLNYLQENHITTIIWVPTVLNYFLSAFKKSDLDLKRIVWTGEILSTKVFLELKKIFQNAIFINSYGPTEITDTCTFYIANRKINEFEILPIGKPFSNTRTYLFDENMQIISSNETNKKGILYIGGTGVAAGYFKDTEKTRAVFIQNPLHDDYEDIIYNTGDIVAYNEYKELVCYGRADNQIKYKGHRIELGEIENIAIANENINNALCIFDEQIILIYNGNVAEIELKEFLKVKLPNYMLPTKLIKVKELKLNQNGKIDRKFYKLNYKELL